MRKCVRKSVRPCVKKCVKKIFSACFCDSFLQVACRFCKGLSGSAGKWPGFASRRSNPAERAARSIYVYIYNMPSCRYRLSQKTSVIQYHKNIKHSMIEAYSRRQCRFCQGLSGSAGMLPGSASRRSNPFAVFPRGTAIRAAI